MSADRPYFWESIELDANIYFFKSHQKICLAVDPLQNWEGQTDLQIDEEASLITEISITFHVKRLDYKTYYRDGDNSMQAVPP